MNKEDFKIPYKEKIKLVLKFVSHLSALIVFLYAIFGFSNYNIESTLQETTLVLMQIKYIFIALLIEAVNYFNNGQNSKS